MNTILALYTRVRADLINTVVLVLYTRGALWQLTNSLLRPNDVRVEGYFAAVRKGGYATEEGWKGTRRNVGGARGGVRASVGCTLTCRGYAPMHYTGHIELPIVDRHCTLFEFLKNKKCGGLPLRVDGVRRTF